MAFSDAQAASWDASALLFEAGGLPTTGTMGCATPSSLDALLFDVDDAEPTCSPHTFTSTPFGAAEAARLSVSTALAAGHMLKTYPSAETRPQPATRRGNEPSARRKWPWPLHSDRKDRVPQKEQRERLAQDLKEMEEFVAGLAASRALPSLSTAGDRETIAAVRVRSEREAKREAECRNQRLRQLNLEHAKRLKRIDSVVAQSLSDYDHLQVSERVEYNETKDALLYRDLFSSQDGQLKHLDDMFQAAGITPELKSAEKAKVVTDDKGGAYIRFVQARVVPFPMMTILRAMKQYHKRYMVLTGQSGTLNEGHEDFFSPTAFKSRYILRNAGAANAKPLPLGVRGVGRIVLDGSDSVRGIWSGQGDWPPEYAPGGVATLPIREKGWIKMREIRSRTGQVLTLMQSCLHMTPGVAGSDSSMPVMSAESVSMLSDAIIPSYIGILHERQQSMENAYMDQLMCEQKVGSKKAPLSVATT